eukprot:4038931-Pyramimonas_sp.AAC.1
MPLGGSLGSLGKHAQVLEACRRQKCDNAKVIRDPRVSPWGSCGPPGAGLRALGGVKGRWGAVAGNLGALLDRLWG